MLIVFYRDKFLDVIDWSWAEPCLVLASNLVNALSLPSSVLAGNLVNALRRAVSFTAAWLCIIVRYLGYERPG